MQCAVGQLKIEERQAQTKNRELEKQEKGGKSHRIKVKKKEEKWKKGKISCVFCNGEH
jgi:hypothetical protein